MTEPTAHTDKLIRGALILVMGAALTVGTWSIYTLLTTLLHAPTPVAIFGCGMFDAAAFFFALLAQRYATTPDSGLAPRLAMLAMVASSAWVNWTHAQLEHWGSIGYIVAAAPVVAELSFEAYHRYIDREARRQQGRTPASLPVLGKPAWILHPRRARQVIDAAVLARLEAAAAVETHRLEVVRAEVGQHPGTPGHALPAVSGVLPGVETGTQTVRLQIETVAGPVPAASGHLVPARVERPARLPEPVLAAQAAPAPDGHSDQASPLSIAEAVRTAIAQTGTNLDDIAARVAEIKPGAREDSVRREARRQVAQLPPTGLYM